MARGSVLKIIAGDEFPLRKPNLRGFVNAVLHTFEIEFQMWEDLEILVQKTGSFKFGSGFWICFLSLFVRLCGLKEA